MAAKFPTTAPTVYTDKSTSNDVGDSSHWDGADANQVKAEIVAIAAKVGVDGDSETSSHDYRIAELEDRKRVTTGSGTLGTSTATTITDAEVTTSSVVLVQPTCGEFWLPGPPPYVSAVNSGSFYLAHGDAAGTETVDYVVVN